MKKVLWVSDGVTPTGFSRVAHNLIERVPNDIEVYHLAINYFGDPHNYKHKIYPAYPGGDIYGFRRLPKLINIIKPDVVFLFNDINIINRYLIELMKNDIKDVPIYVYYPVDSEYIDEEYFSLFPRYVKKVFVYTEFGKNETQKVYDTDVIILPHGVDKGFYRLPNYKEQKERIVGDKDLFIVLNSNRNQPRKRIDITIEAFSYFAENKDNVRLYLHMGVIDTGWNIIKLAKRYGIEDKLIITNRERGIQRVQQNILNAIFNSADVGINTSEGEGFGLTAIEMGKLGIPQVVPYNSANIELFGDIGVTVDTTMKNIAPGTNAEFSVVHPMDVAEALDKLYKDKDFYNKVSIDTRNKFNSDYFDWDKIAKKLWDEFE